MFRSSVILIWVCSTLALSTLSVGAFALQQTIKVATLTTELASSALDLAATKAANKAKLSEQKANHQLELKKQKAKIKAKERLRRSIMAVPMVGTGLMVYFEEQDYQEWKQDNPDGNPSKYACEVAASSALVMDQFVADTVDFLQNLPESVRPEPESVKARLKIPTCDL
jgi:hypothetical protein